MQALPVMCGRTPSVMDRRFEQSGRRTCESAPQTPCAELTPTNEKSTPALEILSAKFDDFSGVVADCFLLIGDKRMPYEQQEVLPPRVSHQASIGEQGHPLQVHRAKAAGAG